MAFDNCFVGLCPERLLQGRIQELWLNKRDVFECPECRLLISLASGLRAAVLRRRGQGDFVSREDPYYCAKRHVRGPLLVREHPANFYEADGFSDFKNGQELEQYLKKNQRLD